MLRPFEESKGIVVRTECQLADRYRITLKNTERNDRGREEMVRNRE